jgi:WD40 repeat protein
LAQNLPNTASIGQVWANACTCPVPRERHAWQAACRWVAFLCQKNMKIKKASLVVIVFYLLGCNAIYTEPTSILIPTPTNTIQATDTNTFFLTPTSTTLPENTTLDITTTSKDGQIILKGFNAPINWLFWSHDGKRLFIGTQDVGVIIYDTVNKKVIANFYNGFVIQQLALSPDEKTLAVVIYAENSIRLINPNTGNQLNVLNIHQYWPGGLIFSPSSKVLASVNTHDNTIILWDVVTGKEIKRLSIEGNLVGRTWFAPDGKTFMAYSEGDKFMVWDATSWQLQKTFHCKSAGFSSFSPDGNRVAVLGAGNETKENGIWDFKNCKKLFSLDGAQSWAIAVTYDKTGKYIAAGGTGGADRIVHTITIWNAGTGELVRNLITGDYAVTTALAFNPDGTKLASATSTNLQDLIIWDLNQP